MERRSPPANVLRAVGILEEKGPQDPHTLSSLLRATGAVIPASVLTALPSRFPEHLQLLPDGRLAIGSAPPSAEGAGSARAEALPRATEANTDLSLLAADHQILAVDALRHPDGRVEVGVCTLDQNPIELTFEASSGAETTSLLAQVSEFAAEVTATVAVALSPGARNLSDMLSMAIESHNGAPPRGLLAQLPVADLLVLSVLADPDLDGRTLDDLDGSLNLNSSGQSRARRIAAAFESLRRAIPQNDPTWRLAVHLLRTTSESWARLLPPAVAPAVADALTPAVDPLLSPAVGARPFTATRGVDVANQALFDSLGFRLRPQQFEMAQAVARAFDKPEDLLVEAPTGTGKTVAYLVPAAARSSTAANATVVATHTKVLQQQVRREVERLREAGLFPSPFRQLFGVSNYVCAREIAESVRMILDASADVDANETTVTAVAAAVAARALASTANGIWDDISDRELARSVPGYLAARLRLTTDSNECEGHDCDWAAHCPLMLRRNDLERQPGVISTNHAVVAAWAGNPLGAPAGLLGTDRPAAFVFDEAHRLEDSLTSAWTDELTSDTLAGLAIDLGRSSGRAARVRRLMKSAGLDAPGLGELASASGVVRRALADLNGAVLAYHHEYAGRYGQVELRRGVVDTRIEFAPVRDAALRLGREFRLAATRIEASAALIQSTSSEASPRRKALHRAWRTLRSLYRRCSESADLLGDLTELRDGHRFVHLLEAEPVDADATARAWSYQRVPIEVGRRFREQVIDRTHSVVLTSATLRVDGSFTYTAGRLGMELGTGPRTSNGREATATLSLPSPFDFDAQSMLILTSHLPVPIPANEDEFCDAAAADTIGFLSLTGGRTLSLFAARRRMEKVVEGVRIRESELTDRGVTLLVQGEHSSAQIQTRFREDHGSVLFGLQSYWEGFDAPGRTLSFLQLEKAPYPPPDDPLVSARSRAVADLGGNPFLDYVVPRTAISLAQGFGRLIRTPEDRGAALFLDRRLQHPSQANDILLNSLPTKHFVVALDRDEAWSTGIAFVDGVAPDVTQALDAPVSRVMQLLDELALRLDEPLEPQLARAARELFGIDQLLPDQVRLMEAVLQGKDALGVLPTGAGKSLVFQLPAVLRADAKATVVVSPLVALIKDQVDELRSRRGLRVVAGLTGRSSASERTECLRDLASGRLRLLYVAPERLVSDIALRTALSQTNLGLLVVDEAHCISSWGHDFRPEFRQIARSVRDFRLGATLALTATASSEVEADVVDSLSMSDPLVVRRPVTRPDLRYRVMRVGSDQDRVREILRLHEKDQAAAGLVYVTRRATADEVAWILRQAGVNARAYHAGMDPAQRESVQDDFIDGTTRVVVATKAFGMGVNKSDIAWVVHYDPPESLESYVQEAGRAARDRRMSGDCLLLFRDGDLVRHRRMIGQSRGDEDLSALRRLWAALDRRRDQRGGATFDLHEVATECTVDVEDMSTLMGWLERSSHLERLPDRSSAGMVAPGRGEPDDRDERSLFLRVTLEQLGLRVGQRRRISDLDSLAGAVGISAEELEQSFIDWTIRRFLTYQPTQRLWRVRLSTSRFNEHLVADLMRRWRQTQFRRLEEMAAYVSEQDGGACRRVRVARVFGDAPTECARLPGAELCDVCASARPHWHEVPLDRVPDPERLVDVETVILQAVRWATSFAGGSYSESGLRHALLGQEQYASGRQLGSGLLSCPQFGALKYLRGAARRLELEIDRLIKHAMITREQVRRRDPDTGSYGTLRLGDAGWRHLTGADHS